MPFPEKWHFSYIKAFSGIHLPKLHDTYSLVIQRIAWKNCSGIISFLRNSNVGYIKMYSELFSLRAKGTLISEPQFSTPATGLTIISDWSVGSWELLQALIRADFWEGDATKALFSEKRFFFQWKVKRGEAIQWMRGLVRISTGKEIQSRGPGLSVSTGKEIQWRGPGHSVNRRTLKTEKLLSSSLPENQLWLVGLRRWHENKQTKRKCPKAKFIIIAGYSGPSNPE